MPEHSTPNRRGKVSRLGNTSVNCSACLNIWKFELLHASEAEMRSAGTQVLSRNMPCSRRLLNRRSALAHSFRGYTYLLEGEEIRARAGNNKALLDSAIKTFAAAFPDLDE